MKSSYKGLTNHIFANSSSLASCLCLHFDCTFGCLAYNVEPPTEMLITAV